MITTVSNDNAILCNIQEQQTLTERNTFTRSLSLLWMRHLLLWRSYERRATLLNTTSDHMHLIAATFSEAAPPLPDSSILTNAFRIVLKFISGICTFWYVQRLSMRFAFEQDWSDTGIYLCFVKTANAFLLTYSIIVGGMKQSLLIVMLFLIPSLFKHAP